jgi:uncharacterized membrane protein
MKPTTIALSVLAGAALIETALIPGIALGAAAVLAPKFLPKTFVARLRRRRPQQKPVVARAESRAPEALAKGEIRRVIFKTITFRTIVTSLDFTSNYIVIGNLASAAGLSAFSLAAGPFFFFLHEMLWRKYGPAQANAEIALPAPALSSGGFRINRPLAKTLTYRACATTSDFSVNYVVVGDLAAAAGLTAFGFIVGPFVYYYHEKAWDRFSPSPDEAGPRPIGAARPADKVRPIN